MWRDVVKALTHHVRRSHGSGGVLSLLRGVAVYSGEYARLAFQGATYRQSNSDSAVSHSWFHVRIDSIQTRIIPNTQSGILRMCRDQL